MMMTQLCACRHRFRGGVAFVGILAGIASFFRPGSGIVGIRLYQKLHQKQRSLAFLPNLVRSATRIVGQCLFIIPMPRTTTVLLIQRADHHDLEITMVTSKAIESRCLELCKVNTDVCSCRHAQKY